MAENVTITVKDPMKYTTILGNVGFAAGVGYAIYKKTGFWKGWGYGIIFSIIGVSIGYAVDTMKQK